MVKQSTLDLPLSYTVLLAAMHLGNNVLLLVAVSLLVNVEAVPATAQSDSVLSGGQHIGQLLRPNNVRDERLEKEERGISASAVETIANAVESKVNTAQLKSWLNSGESADDVFKLLTLNNIADDVLANPKLEDWIEYMKLFNRKNPRQQTSLIKTLISHFDDDGVARLIQKAMQGDSTAKMAKRLEFEQFQRWLGQEKTPKEVLTLLKLDNNRYDLFEKPELLTWVKYLDDWNKAYPDQQTTLFARISPLLDEGILAEMLIKAKSVASTEKIALRVQAEQTASWLKNEKTPDDLFTLLRLNREGDILLENPIFDAWVKYADDFREMYPKVSFDPIATISDHYPAAAVAKMIVEASKSPSTSSIAHRLNTEQFRDWLNSHQSPVRVFSLLELDKAGDKLFQSPVIGTWLNYANFYNTRRQKVSVTTLLKKRFGDEVLAGILTDAQQVPATKEEATKLLTSLVGRWPKNRVHPDNVYKWLRVEGREEADGFRLFYERYAAAYKKARNG
ncbi:hypothetical protein V7S43_011168 [Phytophthora oleae]|uniref:RxLR effector PexRD54 WY domain-containing protein n=1 Tax=Phytophthora oleae TaxID=2107226 RepID=A0ABD3FA40_9STRA